MSDLKKIWNNLIRNIISSQRIYHNYSISEIDWLTNNLVDLFLKSEFLPESSYRCIALLNRNIKYGRYALLFNKDIYDATSTRDLEKLKIICTESKYPELEALNDEEQKQWNDGIGTEMLSYNLYTDREVISHDISININSKLELCHDEALSFKMSKKGEYINSQTDNIVFLSEMTDKLIITPMREIDLIFLLLSNGNNPYTNQPLSEPLKNVLIGKNREIMLICRRAAKLGYKHEYKF